MTKLAAPSRERSESDRNRRTGSPNDGRASVKDESAERVLRAIVERAQRGDRSGEEALVRAPSHRDFTASPFSPAVTLAARKSWSSMHSVEE